MNVLMRREYYSQKMDTSASDEEKVGDRSSDKSEDIEKEAKSFEADESYTSLMVQQVQEDRIEDKGQRWNIFQSECKTSDTKCKLIIDGGSYTNEVSKGLLDSLGLRVWKHPQPHLVEWMYHTEKLKVTHKVCINFSVGNYIDRVICDVLTIGCMSLIVGKAVAT